MRQRPGNRAQRNKTTSTRWRTEIHANVHLSMCDIQRKRSEQNKSAGSRGENGVFPDPQVPVKCDIWREDVVGLGSLCWITRRARPPSTTCQLSIHAPPFPHVFRETQEGEERERARGGEWERERESWRDSSLRGPVGWDQTASPPNRLAPVSGPHRYEPDMLLQ